MKCTQVAEIKSTVIIQPIIGLLTKKITEKNYKKDLVKKITVLNDKKFRACNQGGSKHGRPTFGVPYEDCYAGEISRFVCNICLR